MRFSHGLLAVESPCRAILDRSFLDYSHRFITNLFPDYCVRRDYSGRVVSQLIMKMNEFIGRMVNCVLSSRRIIIAITDANHSWTVRSPSHSLAIDSFEQTGRFGASVGTMFAQCNHIYVNCFVANTYLGILKYGMREDNFMAIVFIYVR